MTVDANGARPMDYQKNYRQSHEAAVVSNRQLQGRRDTQRRIRFLVKNNLAVDLK